MNLARTPLLAAFALLIVAVAADEPDPFAQARNRMVQRHLVERGIKDKRVLDAFRTGPFGRRSVRLVHRRRRIRTEPGAAGLSRRRRNQLRDGRPE